MKVVLLKDVKGMGRAHSVADVSDGHALHFLIPKKLAIPATAGALKQAEGRTAQLVAERAVQDALVAERIAALAEGKLQFAKKANEQGHLYDALDAKEIAEKAQLPADVIRIEKPFKELGVHEVPVSYGEQFGKFEIEIVAE